MCGKQGMIRLKSMSACSHAERTIARHTDMPTSKHKAEPAGNKSEKETNKKRSIEESRAAAREWNLQQRRLSSASPVYSDNDTPSSSKKLRTGKGKGPAMDKAEMRQKSRQRAKEFAQTLLPHSKLHAGGTTPSDSVTQGTEDVEEDTGESIGTRTDGPQNSSTAQKEVMGRRTEESFSMTLSAAPLGPPPLAPPMPDFVRSSDGSVSKQSSLPSTGDAGQDVAESSPLQTLRRRRTSFLRHAYTTPSTNNSKSHGRFEGGGDVKIALPESLRSSRDSSLSNVAGSKPSTARPGDSGPRKSFKDKDMGAKYGKDRRGYERPSRQSTPRKSFLDVAKIDSGGNGPPRMGNTLQMENREMKPAVSREMKEEANPLPAAGTSNTSGNKEGTKFSTREKPAVPKDNKREADAVPAAGASTIPRKQEGVKLFSYYACPLLLVLAPSMLLAIVLGVLVPAWSNVRLAAGEAWNTVSGLGKIPSFREKCYLSSGEDRSVCKEGTEPTNCPRSAICNRGYILYCDKMFEKASDGRSCKVSKAVKEEANVVAEALRDITIDKTCMGDSLLLTCMVESSVTLQDAANIKERGPLTLLAAMPPGNVAGIIDLEVTEDGRPGGFGRMARLSEATARKIKLPWKCRARLLVGNLLLTHWKIFLASYALLMVILYRDVRGWTTYRRRIKVCIMRDEAYKALLDHTAKDPSPMQESHIQAYVGDRQRANGDQGSTGEIQKTVRKLWPHVEKEVEHDTRIRRNYKNVRGQHNVPCWQWVGPSSASFEDIGRLDPGRAPRLWLLRWLNEAPA